MTNPVVADLLDRSNRLGADPKNTNYAGGNTSATGTETDPVTGEEIQLLWVKGSGGDLGTLTEPGLAVLRLDRMRALVDVYPGVEREDEMVAAFDYCLHGKGGAAPSIDTAMHGLVDSRHVDHLHPDSGIAIATAADGERLTKEAFGDKVVWVPWRRPGFQLGLDIAAIKEANPQAIGCILGGHGITAWGDTSEEAEANSLWIIETAQAYIDANGRKDPFGKQRAKFAPLPEEAEEEPDIPLNEIDGLEVSTVAVLADAGYRTLNDILDLDREHVFAPGNVHFLLPPDDVVETVPIAPRQIARAVQPRTRSVGERVRHETFGGEPRPPEVAA